MLSSLASFFPMISPRAESIAPETQGNARAFTYLSFTLGIAFAYFRESLIRALILLSIVGRQDRKGITSSMGKPNPGIPSQQPQLIGRVDFASAALVHLLRRKLTLCQRIQDPGHPLRVQIFKFAFRSVSII
ncbi:hypothetical protein TSUD_198700 [Trifolium subterraneum]|uniref:Uncharacterized protein n=1 Tax=Trifolium subterraneum TaxID=3900 RepID=A0A2Z6MA32_TRISU|nr:hypothetical protein TSUD_198700 [Trifolium subterraneum]